MIAIKKLVVQYGKKTALTADNLVFPNGLCYLLGPNGAGKTTMMSALAGLNGHMSKESVFSCQHAEHCDEARNPDLVARGQVSNTQVGYLPQRYELVGSASALNQVKYAAWARGCALESLAERAESALQQVGLRDVSKSKTRTLSGGMRQRLGIACVLTSDPHVIMLDEPTVGLDPVQRRSFMELADKLAKERTVLISTHILTDIQSTPGHVIVLNSGAVAFSGSSAELAHSGSPETPSLLGGYEACLAQQR